MVGKKEEEGKKKEGERPLSRAKGKVFFASLSSLLLPPSTTVLGKTLRRKRPLLV